MQPGTVVMINKKYPDPQRHYGIAVVQGEWTDGYHGQGYWECADGGIGGLVILRKSEVQVLYTPS